MNEAWNICDVQACAQAFTEEAYLIAIEGTHFKGRDQIVEFHQPLFESVLKGTRIEGGVHFVRFLGPALAVMHAWTTTTLPGQTNASSSRDSLELFVLTRREGVWRCDAMLSARRISMEQQQFADEFSTLSFRDQRAITHRISTLRH